MDGPGDYHTKWSKSDRERQLSYDIAYVILKKKRIQMNLFTKKKQTHRLREGTYGYQGGRVGGEIDWELGIEIYILLYLT